VKYSSTRTKTQIKIYNSLTKKWKNKSSYRIYCIVLYITHYDSF